jgi:hypothetical protein
MDADPCVLVKQYNLNETGRVHQFQAQNQITT